MRISNMKLTGLLTAAALVGGLTLLGDAGDANAQMTGGHGWTPAVRTVGDSQSGPSSPAYGYGHGNRQGHNGGTYGNRYAGNNTSAGYHSGHGSHDGPYQGCGW